MKKTTIVSALAAPLLMFALTLSSRADAPPTVCQDGTTSTATGRGACSGHGGIQKAAKSSASAPAAPAAATAPAAMPAPAAATPAPAAAAPADATAKCKDGSYSKSKSRSGACSKHGGVADWLTAQ